MSEDIGRMTTSELKNACIKIHNEKDNHLELKDQLQEQYNYGRCMFLAIALHRRYGFEIQAAIVNDKDGESWIGHAWVKLPDGLFFDIMGKYEDSSELDSFGDITKKELDEKSLAAYFDNDSEYEKEIKKAMVVTKYYLEPNHNLNNKKPGSELRM